MVTLYTKEDIVTGMAGLSHAVEEMEGPDRHMTGRTKQAAVLSRHASELLNKSKASHYDYHTYVILCIPYSPKNMKSKWQ